MNLANRILSKTTRESARALKRLKQTLRRDSSREQLIVFVVGCQRSGTSMMNKTFERHPEAAVYDEISPLSSGDKIEGLRLNPIPDVKRVFERNPADIIVTKPLVESHRLIHLLDSFPNSKAIWMYRDYRDVVNSNIKRFGAENGFNDLAPIISNEEGNWRNEIVSETTRQIISKYSDEPLSSFDAAALFWYSRNMLFFDQDLQSDRRILLCSYDSFVSSTASATKDIYNFLGLDFSTNILDQRVNAASVKKGNHLELNSRIDSLCQELYKQLEEADPRLNGVNKIA